MQLLLSTVLLLALAVTSRAVEDFATEFSLSLTQDIETPVVSFALPSLSSFQDALPTTAFVANNAKTRTCAWSAYKRKCSLDKWYILSQLEKSQSHLARVYLTFLRWKFGVKRSSKQKDNPISEFGLSDEALLHFINDYSSSPCFETTSTLCNLTMIQRACRDHASRARCIHGSFCTWNKGKTECEVDSWNLAYGIKSSGSFPRVFDKVLQNYSESYTAAFHDKFGESIRDGRIHWDDVLQWDGPQYLCPAKVHQAICAYATVYASSFPVSIYCNGKYPDLFSIHECHLDPRCQPSIESGPICVPSQGSVRNMTGAATQVFVDGIEDPFLKSLFETSVYCQQFGSQSTCHEYDNNSACQWSQNTKKCVVGAHWIVSRIWKPNDDDPLCRLFEIPKQTPCDETDYHLACILRRKQCEWHQKQKTCETKIDVYLEEIFKEDKDLKQQLRQDQVHCRSLKRPHCS